MTNSVTKELLGDGEKAMVQGLERQIGFHVVE